MHIKELTWKCRRGKKELDTLLLSFLNNNYSNIEDKHQKAFQRLLNFEDPFIYEILVKNKLIKDIEVNEIADMIRNMNA